MDTDTKELLRDAFRYLNFIIIIIGMRKRIITEDKQEVCTSGRIIMYHNYNGMHKEKTKLPRFSRNPCKDLESFPRIPCNLLGFICHHQGLIVILCTITYHF